MIRAWFVLLVALGANGCTFVADVNGTSVVAGDERGGRVSRVTTFTKPGALNMANAWCAQYRLVAQETRVMFVTDSMDFACVPPA